MTTADEELIKVVGRTNELLKEALNGWTECGKKNKVLEREVKELHKQIKKLNAVLSERSAFMSLEKEDIQDIIDTWDCEYQCSDKMIDEIFDWIQNEYDGDAGHNYMRTLGEDIVNEFGEKILSTSNE